MGLVDYSDSEASETEGIPAIKAPVISKSGFHKVVDRSNPGKIRVSLPQPTRKDDTNGEEPPTKRAKIGGGGLGGFNSFLPAPKRASAVSSGSLGGSTNKKSGLTAGISLKTGAAPGFSREPEPEREVEHAQYTESEDLSGGGMGLPPSQSTLQGMAQTPAEEVKLVGKPLMFKPLSVSRKPTKKKKPSTSMESMTVTVEKSQRAIDSVSSQVDRVAPRAKVSLFSVSSEPSESALTASTGTYEPLIYGVKPDEDNDLEVEGELGAYNYGGHLESTPSAPQSLDNIATDLNLSAAERRQLFGRQKASKNGAMPMASNVINFNLDEEYKHNEEIRASGEQISHNPVRAIAPGKHNLKQLVNAAASQKEALEESFAKGRNNRAEASSRYGW